MNINHTAEFNLAFRFVTETNKNIFLTGKAGTGKTTFLKYLRENSSKRIVVAAPTGVAAVNAQGVTIHSLFQLPLGIILPSSDSFQFSKDNFKSHQLISKIHYSKEKIDLLRKIDLLVIDEVSMLASYIVDAIDTILRFVRKNPNEPFGGVQILFIGDLNQLPPVVKNEDWEILRDYYSTIFFFDSIVLRENVPVIIELKNIYRQKDDKFIEILNGIRNNDITEENFNLLNSRLKRNFIPKDDEGYITLTTHNYQADEINKRNLDKLTSHKFTFEAEIIGEFPDHTMPAEKELILKRGAQVMFLKNDTAERKYFNGKIGTITEISWDNIKVFCKDDNEEIVVKKSEWQNIRYRVDPETHQIKEEILGGFIQYPLRLAWAITVHKSQGLTFDKVIINAERAFAAGQVYVALSRCTSLDGLVLISPINFNSLSTHKNLNEWFSLNQSNDLQKVLNDSRQFFIQRELQNIFTLDKLDFQLSELKGLVNNYNSYITAASILWLNELIETYKNLFETSERFKKTLFQLSKGTSDAENNIYLQKRIKNAADYFCKNLEVWRKSFYNHTLKFSTKKIAKEFDKKLIEINDIVSEILIDINFCKNGFNLKEFIKFRNNLKYSSSIDKVKRLKSTYDKTIKSDTVNETVKLLRENKTIEQIALERNLVISTIESHLARAIKIGLIKIDEIMSLSEVKNIARYFHGNIENVKLKEIKEKAPDEITYGKLRMVLAWLQENKK